MGLRAGSQHSYVQLRPLDIDLALLIGKTSTLAGIERISEDLTTVVCHARCVRDCPALAESARVRFARAGGTTTAARGNDPFASER